jgi:predicted nuclease of restriction endonuclease-like RecB superfamily
MLPTDLLLHRYQGEAIVPKRLAVNGENLAIAQEAITCFTQACNHTRSELNQQLQDLEGDGTNYRIKRGLTHLLTSSFCTFETISPLDPPTLRQRVFSLAAQTVPSIPATTQTLEQLAVSMSQELDREVSAAQIRTGLYADHPDNQILTAFEAPTPEALLHRYNLSQVQGIFYKATQIIINAHRNDPGEYKLLFRYLKLFSLMAYIEGDADHGFTLKIDGPASVFSASTRYGLALAKLLPALLHVTRWSLTATLTHQDTYTQKPHTRRFTLDSDCGLVSHYPPGKPYDSMLEASFAERWQKTKTEWHLEREIDLIPIPGSVMIPDFRLVHPDGRTFLLEIVGYWRPEYLKKKFSQVRQADRTDLILAISERLNLDKAGVNFRETPARLVWFKDKLSPKAVLEALEG